MKFNFFFHESRMTFLHLKIKNYYELIIFGLIGFIDYDKAQIVAR